MTRAKPIKGKAGTPEEKKDSKKDFTPDFSSCPF